MKRRQVRGFFLICLFALAALLFYDGFGSGGMVGGVPSQVVGFILVAVGVLGLLGVNVWYGGPLDPRNDPEPAAPALTKRQAVADWGTRKVISSGELARSFWVVFTQATLLLVAALVAASVVRLLRIPYLAYAGSVAPEQVALRCLDNHEAEPLYLIKGYEERLTAIGMNWPKPREVRKLVTQATPAGFGHTAHDHRDAVLGRRETTTPHTRLTSAQIAAARRGLEGVYDSSDPQVWSQVGAWGETLFLRWWTRSFDPEAADVTSPLPHVPPWRGTEDEKLWFAWQRLEAGGGADELANLVADARKAYPRAEEYEAALAWARLFHERRERYYHDWRKRTGRLEADREWVGTRVLPPPTEFTLAWILERHVGLTETSRSAVHKRWLQYFPHREAVARRWGRELERQRRQAGEPLPPSSDNVALLCVIEHLAGWDSAGVQARQAALQFFEPDRLRLQAALTLAYPSDEVFKTLASGDALDLVTLRGWDFLDRSVTLQNLVWLLAWFLFLAVAAFLCRALVLDTVDARLLRLSGHDLFRAYYDTQTSKNAKGWLLALLVIPLAKWAWDWWRLKTPHELLMPTPLHLLVGIYMSVLAGGLLIGTLNRLVAVVLLRCGVDVAKVWLDEIIGTLLGIAALAYFGNTWLSLAVFVAVAVLPEAYRRWRQSRPGAVAEAPAARQPLLFENHPTAAMIGIAVGTLLGGLCVVSLSAGF